MYTYELYQWLCFFYIYCFFGWIFESAYVSIRKRHFVNRGFLRLPMLPLYGTGAVMMLWVSIPVKNNIFLVYILGVIAATILEYITGYVMERLFKVKYWDYSTQNFQLHGYICLSSSIAWGFLTIFLTDVIHKPIERFVLSLSPLVMAAILLPVTSIFLIDGFRSIKTALDFEKLLETLENTRAELEDLQVQLALLKGETVQKAEEIKEKIAIISAKRRELSHRFAAHRAYLFHNNPSATSNYFSEAFREFKEVLEHIRK